MIRTTTTKRLSKKKRKKISIQKIEIVIKKKMEKTKKKIEYDVC